MPVTVWLVRDGVVVEGPILVEEGWTPPVGFGVAPAAGVGEAKGWSWDGATFTAPADDPGAVAAEERAALLRRRDQVIADGFEVAPGVYMSLTTEDKVLLVAGMVAQLAEGAGLLPPGTVASAGLTMRAGNTTVPVDIVPAFAAAFGFVVGERAAADAALAAIDAAEAAGNPSAIRAAGRTYRP